MVERLHNRVEREVDAALRPFGYYEPQVESSVNQREWTGTSSSTSRPAAPVLIDHLDVRVDGPGGSRPAVPAHPARICRSRAATRLNHKAYEDIKSDLQRTAATYGYLDARLIRNELVGRSAQLTRQTSPWSSIPATRYRFGATSISRRGEGEPGTPLPALPRG